jgi:hypothetical protein
MRRFADTGEKRMLLRRIIIYTLLFFFLGVMQCSFFSRLKPFGAVPDIVLGGICAILMLDNKRSAAVCAVAAGYFIDALGAVPPSFSPLFYLICVAVLGRVSDKLMPSALSYALLMLPALLLRAAYTYVSIWINMASAPALGTALIRVMLPEALSTFVFCLPIYFLVKLCMLPIGAKGRFEL